MRADRTSQVVVGRRELDLGEHFRDVRIARAGQPILGVPAIERLDRAHTPELLAQIALKHGFPHEKPEGEIIVAYDVDGPNWRLSVADNGVGKPDGVFAQPKSGLGTGIVKALARQIDAYVETSATPEGTVVSIVHATFSTEAGRAAQKAPISFVGSPAAVLHAEVPIASQKRDS